MADRPDSDIFSYMGDWSAAADQFLSLDKAGLLQTSFSPEERAIIRYMLHGSIHPPQRVSDSLLQEALAFRQRVLEECENRLRSCYVGPLIGNQFLRRLEELKSVVEIMIPEVISLRDFGTVLQEEFPSDEDARITRDFPSGIFSTMDEHFVSEADTAQHCEIDSEPLPTMRAPGTYPEALKPQASKRSGLHHILSDKPDKT